MFDKFFPYLKNTSEQAPFEYFFRNSFLKLPVNNFSSFPIFLGFFSLHGNEENEANLQNLLFQQVFIYAPHFFCQNIESRLFLLVTFLFFHLPDGLSCKFCIMFRHILKSMN